MGGPVNKTSPSYRFGCRWGNRTRPLTHGEHHCQELYILRRDMMTNRPYSELCLLDSYHHRRSAVTSLVCSLYPYVVFVRDESGLSHSSELSNSTNPCALLVKPCILPTRVISSITPVQLRELTTRQASPSQETRPSTSMSLLLRTSFATTPSIRNQPSSSFSLAPLLLRTFFTHSHTLPLHTYIQRSHPPYHFAHFSPTPPRQILIRPLTLPSDFSTHSSGTGS